ncbi:MAG: hypothetical protein E7311_06930 [Clostridiales bacterium]|nr:hypothetical protein [Clostridiales bacterium]
MFVGREEEIDFLNKIYQSEKFELVIIYGRRRVGKTELIKKFCEDKSNIFYTAQNNNREQALQNFSDKVYNFFSKSEYVDRKDMNYSHIIEYLTKIGIVFGYEDNTYKPNYLVTLAELIKIICISIIDTFGQENYISPIIKKDYGWATEYISYGLENNLITKDESEKYNEVITCHDARNILIRVKDFYMEKGHEIKTDFNFLINYKKLTREELCLAILFLQKNAPTFYFKNWNEALEYISENIENEKMVLIIDEYQYLAEIESGISSIFQNIIDHKLKDKKLKIILMSSSMSFKEEILSHEMPLYGRQTYQKEIEPLKYYRCQKFYDNFELKEKVMFYSIFDGIPNRLEKIDVKKSFKENIMDLVLNKDSFLYNETENLLKQELKKYYEYEKVLEEIAKGNTKLNDIAQKSSIDLQKAKEIVNDLERLKIVYNKKDVYNQKNKKKDCYKIADNYIAFWYKYIYRKKLLIETQKNETLYNSIMDDINNFIGKDVFENMCIDYLIELQKQSKLDDILIFDEIGGVSWNNSEKKKDEEIDILAYNVESAIFAECKWENDAVGKDIFKILEERANQAIFSQIKNKYYFLFSKSGYTNELKESIKGREDIRLVELEDLYLI